MALVKRLSPAERAPSGTDRSDSPLKEPGNSKHYILTLKMTSPRIRSGAASELHQHPLEFKKHIKISGLSFLLGGNFRR